jgi:AraC-like DNA-binding protein
MVPAHAGLPPAEIRPALGVRVLADLLTDLGRDPERLFTQCGLSREAVKRSTGITLAQELSFIRAALAASGRPDLGLVAGRRHRVPMFGFWGLALASSPNLGSAARVGIEYADLTHTFLRWSFRRGGAVASLVMRPARPLGDLEVFLVEQEAAAVATLLAELIGSQGILHEARFAYPAPAWRDSYVETFCCPLKFDAARHELRVSSQMLERPLPGGDPATAEAAEAECRKLLQRLGPGGGLTVRLRRLLLASRGVLPNQADAAAQLGLSERTLRRRLAEEDTSFRQVADRVRFELVTGYLDDTSLPLDEIAARTGFSDAANLSHAFRRWTGQTPGTWRAAARGARREGD